MDNSNVETRTRTWRACAGCRRRKIKCDGRNPCRACHASKLGCSYEELNRRQSSAVYISRLEKKVEELERMLERRPSASAVSCQAHESLPPSSPAGTFSAEEDEEPSEDASLEHEMIETMVKIDDVETQATNPSQYRGSFSGLSLLQRLHSLCRSVSGLRQGSNDDAASDDIVHAFDGQLPDELSPTSLNAFALLPNKERMCQYIDVVVKEACCNIQFLSMPALLTTVNHMYEEKDHDLAQQDRRHLALLYAITALGRRFELGGVEKHSEFSSKGLIRGLQHFRAAKAMLDPFNCNDLTSVQTLLCMIIFTQACSMMSTCYNYICIAVAASLRLGLHSDTAGAHLPKEEQLERKRTFTVLDILDTYVTIALGLPKTLRGIAPVLGKRPRTAQSPSEPQLTEHVEEALDMGTMFHASLASILANAIEDSHSPVKACGQGNGFYRVRYGKVIAIENSMESWFATLPRTPDSAVDDPSFVKSQLLLRLSYAHVQMVLYRPFLHHALKKTRPNETLSYKAYACGSACVKAAMQVSWLAQTMEAKNLFHEAYWFTALVISFAATCLALFAVSNEGDPTVAEVADSAERLRQLLERHATRNTAAHRCYCFLTELNTARQSHSLDSLWSNVNSTNLDTLPSISTIVPGIGSSSGLNNTLGQGFSDVFRLAHVQAEPDVACGMTPSELVKMQAMAFPQMQSYFDDIQ